MNDPILFGSLSWADVTTIRILRQVELTESRRMFRQPSCTLTVSRVFLLLLRSIWLQEKKMRIKSKLIKVVSLEDEMKFCEHVKVTFSVQY